MVEQTQVELPRLVDHVFFAEKKDLMKLINRETLVYATKVSKPNSYGLLQGRTLVITDKTVFLISKEHVKREVKIDNILGLSKTMPTGNEFGIHVKQA